MKIIKKTNSIIALVLLATTFNSYSMKRPISPHQEKKQILGQAQLPSGEWVDIVGLVLSNDAPMKLLLTNFDFTQLPKDIQHEIIYLLSIETTATSLDSAAITINSLAQVNKELNELINDPKFCLKIIKHLAQKFECSDMKAAKALKTKEAKRRFELQDKLYDLCTNDTSLTEITPYFELLRQQGIDLNFTYFSEFCNGATPLILVVTEDYEDNYTQSELIKFLIMQGADINATNNDGDTVLMHAARLLKEKIIKLLTEQPKLNINQQDNNGCTALHYIFEDAIDRWGGQDIEDKVIVVIKFLLNAGADSEIANNDGETPRTETIEYFLHIDELKEILGADEVQKEYQTIIDLFNDAISKKHVKK